MANKTITQLAALTGAAASIGDVLPIVDISDTSMSSSGTTKKISLFELAAYLASSVPIDGLEIGDLVNTARTIDDPNYLVCDGRVYPKSEYPALSNIINLPPPSFPSEISPQPQIAGPANPGGIDISSDGVYFAVASNTSPFLTIYKRTGETLVALPTPYVIPNAIARGCSFSPDGTYLAVRWSFNNILTNDPSLTIYKRAGDVFTKLPDPVNVAYGNVFTSVKFSPDGLHLITATAANGNRAIIYKRTGDSFVEIVNPFTTPQVESFGVYEYSKTGNFLSMVTSGAARIFKRNGDSYSLIFTSAGLPRPVGASAKFTNNGKFLILAGEGGFVSGNRLQLVKIVGDTFTFLPNAIPVQNDASVRSMSISNDSRFVFVNHASSNPSIDPLPLLATILYEIIGETLIRRQFNQRTPPIQNVNESIFAPNNDVLALVMQVASGSNACFRVLKSASYDQAVSFQVPLAAPVAGTSTYIKAL